MSERPQTWHHGLMARWWAEFNVADPAELDYYGGAIRRFGQPALDLACGAGRILVPLLRQGLDVDGADLSPDMLAQAAVFASASGLSPSLHAQAMHELDLPRRYRTVYICDSFGIGGTRAEDLLALRHVFDHLEPGGALVFSHELPYAGEDSTSWSRWLPGERGPLPRDWPAEGDRRRTTDGDELELVTRRVDFDPLLQLLMLEMRARLWHLGSIVAEDQHLIRLNLYFAQEVLLMLDMAGFHDIAVESWYNGVPATRDDTWVVFVARRPA
jgi:SAM-dependent methyltransferase